MSRGEYLSLEEARKQGKLDQFAKEHPSQADMRFSSLLERMAKGDMVASSDKGGANGNTETVRPGRSRQSRDR